MKTRPTFVAMLPLAGLAFGLFALTAASPIGRRPIGLGITPTLGNYANTSLPLSTDTTVTPDAAPLNATSMNVSTSTNFKGKLEANPASGAVRVTDAHPAGTYTVTVKALNSSGGTASTTFSLTVTTVEACDPVTFTEPTNFSVGTTPTSVTVGDFNGDGWQDLVLVAPDSYVISILLGDGTGNFGATMNIAAEGSNSVAVGDFNGDGKQDLAVANLLLANVSIFLGNGMGSFGAASNFAAGTSPESVAVSDFDGDGRQDLAVANANSNDISILFGDGTGSFNAPINFGVGDYPTFVAVGDFNSDGKQDLATANEDSDNVSILLGDGAGNFSTATNFAAGSGPFSVAVGDFNDDGRQDLAVVDIGSNNLSILLGDGAGNFSAPVNFGVGVSPTSVAVGDFNGDGRQDLAVTNLNSNNVSILLGDGTGNFGAATYLGEDGNPISVAVGDFNGDGKQDLAVTGNSSANVSILLDNCPLTLGTYPDTSVPLSTNTAVTPDAMPGNITKMTVSSSTDFKGKLEGDPVTGVVRVTDAHPAGTYTITVTGFDSTGVRASTTFVLTVTTPETCDPVSFASAANFAAGTNPRSVAVGDFNGDGKQDLATANFNSNNVSILLGDGAGNFSAATNFGTGGGPVSVAVGDFNGDGKQDLAVANQSVANVSILLGDGTGNFSAATNFDAGSIPFSVAVGDFNGDGKQDLAVADRGADSVIILLGDGAGSFASPRVFAAGILPVSVAVGDFNGDGKQDLAVANVGSPNNVSILLGDGAGNFSAATTFGAGSNPVFVAVGDFNGDSRQDLAVVNQESSNVSILLGDGAGSFSDPTNFGVGTLPFSVAVGDFNGDGKQDLAVANGSSNNVSILLGDGMGSFSAATNFGAGTGPRSVAVGDFTGDGKQDLAVSNGTSNNVSILLRNCAPTIATLAGGPVVIGSGDKLTDMAVLSGGFNPTGTITFTLYDPSNAPVYTDVVTVTGNGTYDTSSGTNPGGYLPTTTGTYVWSATYSGDANNTGATDNGENENEAVTPVQPAINTVAGGMVVLGSGAKLTDTAVLSGGFNPQGAINFILYDPSNMAVYTNVVTVNGNGTYDTSTGDNPGGYLPTTTGTYLWSATYTGDINNASAADNGQNENEAVTSASPAINTVAGGTVVIGSGAKLTDTATLSGGSNPMGTITFTLYDPSNAPVYTDVVTVTGNGTYDTSSGNNPGGYLPTVTGTYLWSATYSGDANNTGATDDGQNESETVSPSNQCMVCHKHTQTLVLPCNSLELQRHLDHGDPVGACPNNTPPKNLSNLTR